MALALANPLALLNASKRRIAARRKMRKKYGANWASKPSAVKSFIAELKRQGIYLAEKGILKGPKKGKRRTTKRKGSKKLTRKQILAGFGGKAAQRRAMGGSKSKTSRKGKRKGSKKLTRKQILAGFGGKAAKRRYEKVGWFSGPGKAHGPKFLSPKQRAAGFGGKAAMASAKGLFAPLTGSLADDHERLVGHALDNGLVLTNPFGVAFVTGTLLPAAGVYYAMDYAVPALQNKLYSRVPALGGLLTDVVPHTATGALVSFAARLRPVSNVLSRLPAPVSAFVAATATLAPVIGAFMDISAQGGPRGFLTATKDSLPLIGSGSAPLLAEGEELGALAMSNMGALGLDQMGGLALEPMGAIAMENMGDGMYYQTAPLTAANYGSASLADAYYSGADFSTSEGQALLNGTFVQAFGNPSQRPKRAGYGPSHYAGKPGHRWGWLIKMVGWARARQIANMSPRKRLKTIKAMRQAAIKAFQSEVASAQQSAAATVAASAPATDLPAAGNAHCAPGGAMGAMGPGGYGGVLFAG